MKATGVEPFMPILDSVTYGFHEGKKVPKGLHKPAHRTIVVQICSLKGGASGNKTHSTIGPSTFCLLWRPWCQRSFGARVFCTMPVVQVFLLM
ncbi:MAG: hypothetical protein JWO91_3410 [Acidobacteriaceae bacterium]|nr:hypothetical protein [Acidobacteriaceae bacterium]